jgi:hypothetical protein
MGFLAHKKTPVGLDGKVDLSLMPMDVGFDLKLHDTSVVIPPGTKSVKYFWEHAEVILRGSREQIVEALKFAGYKVVEGSPR